MRVCRWPGREHRISMAGGGASPLSESRWIIFDVFEGVGIVLGCITDRAAGVDSLVLSDSGDEGSKSSRERLAILNAQQRGKYFEGTSLVPDLLLCPSISRVFE